jgi:DNA-binding PadR family transcriptional regulator
MGSSNLLEKLQTRVIQDFMDIFILAEMKGDSLSGYDAIGLIHRRFGLLVSSGTVYSLLYSLERDGWIRGVWNDRKRVYELAEKGERDMKVIAKVNEEVQNFLRRISLIHAT